MGQNLKPEHPRAFPLARAESVVDRTTPTARRPPPPARATMDDKTNRVKAGPLMLTADVKNVVAGLKVTKVRARPVARRERGTSCERANISRLSSFIPPHDPPRAPSEPRRPSVPPPPPPSQGLEHKPLNATVNFGAFVDLGNRSVSAFSRVEVRAGKAGVVVADLEGIELQVRSISHWFPYDRVGVVDADP